MARIFTTTFQFRQATYTALVAVQQLDDHLCIQIRLQDEDLQGLLPSGLLRLCDREPQPTSLDKQPALVQELMHTVSDAVERYLSGHRVAERHKEGGGEGGATSYGPFVLYSPNCSTHSYQELRLLFSWGSRPFAPPLPGGSPIASV